MEHQRRDFVLHLQGPGLNTILNRFIGNLKQEMRQRTAINDDWTVIPDLYTFVVTKVFRSEVEALYGKHIFTTWPRLDEDFWNFTIPFQPSLLGSLGGSQCHPIGPVIES
jgi:hypothetical protein